MGKRAMRNSAQGRSRVSRARNAKAVKAVTDRSSAATGMSVFDRADAGNRRLGRRNRT